MGLKLAILLVFFALAASLFAGFIFLIKDSQKSRRLWNSLSLRLTLASILIALLMYGIYTGQLSSHAPWDSLRQQDGIEKRSYPST